MTVREREKKNIVQLFCLKIYELLMFKTLLLIIKKLPATLFSFLYSFHFKLGNALDKNPLVKKQHQKDFDQNTKRFRSEHQKILIRAAEIF